MQCKNRFYFYSRRGLKAMNGGSIAQSAQKCGACCHIFPAIKEAMDIRYESIAHPRAGLVKLLGEGRHNCPTLVLPKGTKIPNGVRVKTGNGYDYLPSAKAISIYFSKLYGTPVPRGSA